MHTDVSAYIYAYTHLPTYLPTIHYIALHYVTLRYITLHLYIHVGTYHVGFVCKLLHRVLLAVMCIVVRIVVLHSIEQSPGTFLLSLSSHIAPLPHLDFSRMKQPCTRTHTEQHGQPGRPAFFSMS